MMFVSLNRKHPLVMTHGHLLMDANVLMTNQFNRWYQKDETFI